MISGDPEEREEDGGQNNSSPKDIHVLIPGISEYVILHAKVVFKLQIELRLLLR